MAKGRFDLNPQGGEVDRSELRAHMDAVRLRPKLTRDECLAMIAEASDRLEELGHAEEARRLRIAAGWEEAQDHRGFGPTSWDPDIARIVQWCLDNLGAEPLGIDYETSQAHPGRVDLRITVRDLPTREQTEGFRVFLQARRPVGIAIHLEWQMIDQNNGQRVLTHSAIIA